MNGKIPLGLPGHGTGLPTVPLDKGDDTQERFRYQWAIGVMLIAEGYSQQPTVALWCEHHEDFLIERSSGKFVAVQVKTIESENALWRLGMDALDSSISRFCDLEAEHGTQVEQFVFCSNAKPYLPADSAKEETKAKSPTRLIEACKEVAEPALLDETVKKEFDKLLAGIGCDAKILFDVLRKMKFRQGPSLRDYDAVLASEIVPLLPDCSGLTAIDSRRLRESLIGLVQTACRVPRQGVDGALAYIATNGQPEFSIRGKCITLQSASEAISALRRPGFQFVDCGLGVQPQGSPGRAGVLQAKMRNAYINGQYEPLRWRMESAEQRLMERAHADAENFDAIADQITGRVLMVCKDAEADAHAISDERQKGPYIYAQVLRELRTLATERAQEVHQEPIDTLMGVAGMLSGECRFAWGVPLQEADDGA